MKFTKLRQFTLAAFAVCGLALGGHATARVSGKLDWVLPGFPILLGHADVLQQ